MRAEHLIVLGAIVVGCAGGNDASQGAAPPSTAVAPTPPPTTSAPAATTDDPPKDPTSPTAEALKKSLTAYVDAHVYRDAKRAVALYTADAVLITPSPAGRATLTGKDAIQKSYEELYAGIANHRFAFSSLWMKGDVAVVQWVSTFKHSGTLMGMKATDKLAGVTGVSVMKVTPEGLVKEEHRYFDALTIAGQVGLGKQAVRPMVVGVPSNTETTLAKEGDDKNLDQLKAIYAAIEKKSDDDLMAAMDGKSPVFDDFSQPEVYRGTEAVKKTFGDFKANWPDGKRTIVSAFGAGEYAIAEVTFEGTQKSTKKPVKIAAVDIARIKDGKVKHFSSWMDNTDVLLQTGAIKPPPPAPTPPAKK